MDIVYYVSGHGFGHAARASAVMRQLSRNVTLCIKSAAPHWFFEREIGRPVQVVPDVFDSVPTMLSSVQIDRDTTISNLRHHLAQCPELIEREACWLRDRKPRLVVSDVPAVPLAAARAAEINAVVVSNFTWADIYRELLAGVPDPSDLNAQLEALYSTASHAFVPEPALPMPYLPNRRDFPLIGRRGHQVRDRLAKSYELDTTKSWILIYTSNYGLPVDWLALESLTSRYEFLTLTPIEPRPAGMHLLDPDQVSQPDLIASIDGVVTKPGYMTFAECMANGTPLLCVPREGFAEDPVLLEAAERWGGLLTIDGAAFRAGAWGDELAKLVHLAPGCIEMSHGARAIAAELMALLKA